MRDVHVTTGEGELMHLQSALLFYRSDDHTFVTSHPVHRIGDRFQLGPGVPLTRSRAAKIVEGLDESIVYKGFLPERLLAIVPGGMVWWCSPAARTVWFEDSAEGVGRRHGKVQHPALIFAATSGKWYVWAVRGAHRPTPETQLFRAPYFNVWADRGEVCTGNVRLPPPTGAQAMEAYESAFFNSRFTHPNPGFKVRFKGGGVALWRSLLDAPPARFPERVLAPAGLTLDGFVTRLIKEKR